MIITEQGIAFEEALKSEDWDGESPDLRGTLIDLRNLDHDADESTPEQRRLAIALLRAAQSDRCAREDLTDIALGLSLCPIHLVDYAICFDDQDEACAQVRLVHPLHDT